MSGFERCRDLARAFGRARYLTEVVLVNLIEEYGAEKIAWAIERQAGLAHWSLDALCDLIEGKIAATRQAPAGTLAPRSPDRAGPRSVQQFLSENGVKIPKPRRAPGASMDGKYKLPEVERWLAAKGISIKQADEYFYYFGLDTAGNDLWCLRPEHTTNTSEQ